MQRKQRKLNWVSTGRKGRQERGAENELREDRYKKKKRKEKNRGCEGLQ